MRGKGGEGKKSRKNNKEGWGWVLGGHLGGQRSVGTEEGRT